MSYSFDLNQISKELVHDSLNHTDLLNSMYISNYFEKVSKPDVHSLKDVQLMHDKAVDFNFSLNVIEEAKIDIQQILKDLRLTNVVYEQSYNNTVSNNTFLTFFKFNFFKNYKANDKSAFSKLLNNRELNSLNKFKQLDQNFRDILVKIEWLESFLNIGNNSVPAEGKRRTAKKHLFNLTSAENATMERLLISFVGRLHDFYQKHQVHFSLAPIDYTYLNSFFIKFLSNHKLDSFNNLSDLKEFTNMHVLFTTDAVNTTIIELENIYSQAVQNFKKS